MEVHWNAVLMLVSLAMAESEQGNVTLESTHVDSTILVRCYNDMKNPSP